MNVTCVTPDHSSRIHWYDLCFSRRWSKWSSQPTAPNNSAQWSFSEEDSDKLTHFGYSPSWVPAGVQETNFLGKGFLVETHLITSVRPFAISIISFDVLKRLSSTVSVIGYSGLRVNSQGNPMIFLHLFCLRKNSVSCSTLSVCLQEPRKSS